MPSPKNGWKFYATGEFSNFRERWQEICDQHMSSAPGLHINFVLPVLEFFAHPKLRFAVLWQGGSEFAMVFVEPLAFGRWRVFCPSQAVLPFMVYRQVEEICFDLPKYWLDLTLPYFDSNFPVPGLRIQNVESVFSHSTMSVSASDDFEEYWQSRSKNLRSNMRRYLNRIERDGHECRLETLRAYEDMREAVSAYGEIESLGWKAEGGTAIHIENIQGQMYAHMMQKFAQTNGARVYKLYLNDKLAAVRLVIVSGGVAVILKTTYLEEFAQYAPGRVQLYLVLQALFAESDVNVVEFYTKASDDQKQWASDLRDICHLDIYQHVLLKSLMQQSRNVLKKVLKKS